MNLVKKYTLCAQDNGDECKIALRKDALPAPQRHCIYKGVGSNWNMGGQTVIIRISW